MSHNSTPKAALIVVDVQNDFCPGGALAVPDGDRVVEPLNRAAAAFAAAGTKPELEVFDVGMIHNIDFMIKRGQLQPPVYIQFVLGILGGLPATPESLFTLYNAAKMTLGEFKWSVCAGGRNQMGIMATAMAMGGNARVGMEDALYLEKGKLATGNAEIVAKVIRIAKELGREIATPQEARKIIGLKGKDNVGF